MIRLFTFPFRLVFGSVRFGWHAGRAVGISRALFFGLGFGAGVLAASPEARRVAANGVAKGVAAARDARAEPPPPVTPVVTD